MIKFVRREIGTFSWENQYRYVLYRRHFNIFHIEINYKYESNQIFLSYRRVSTRQVSFFPNIIYAVSNTHIIYIL